MVLIEARDVCLKLLAVTDDLPPSLLKCKLNMICGIGPEISPEDLLTLGFIVLIRHAEICQSGCMFGSYAPPLWVRVILFPHRLGEFPRVGR